MNVSTRQFLFGAVFIGIGVYRWVHGDSIDFGLYATAGAAFIANGLTSVESLAGYKRALAITTWVLIFIAGIFFVQVAPRILP
jgi:hypothetical protein